MARNKKNIQVQLEDSKDSDGKQITLLKVRKQIVGKLKKNDGKIIANSSRGNQYHAQDMSRGIELLLSEYNLHK
ncbi:hypothetical protein WR164_10500 [Philodulcilactobacillus myokoensis]|uniref:DUF2969 domain-containing protein n=1 Tax=Philodulcilactobacillus myokoensis TaxID=2929573 RepID=A0A9W6B1Z5_9LACO|nr:DUF2969 family protein [Philodulcilactobacillus myokoensis]GLB47071.1 hypothetical protein WR164_10500 [Philodulcilactobacillus myokoensis]